jgi:hypothetical protein
LYVVAHNVARIAQRRPHCTTSPALHNVARIAQRRPHRTTSPASHIVARIAHRRFVETATARERDPMNGLRRGSRQLLIGDGARLPQAEHNPTVLKGLR